MSLQRLRQSRHKKPPGTVQEKTLNSQKPWSNLFLFSKDFFAFIPKLCIKNVSKAFFRAALAGILVKFVKVIGIIISEFFAFLNVAKGDNPNVPILDIRFAVWAA